MGWLSWLKGPRAVQAPPPAKAATAVPVAAPPRTPVQSPPPTAAPLPQVEAEPAPQSRALLPWLLGYGDASDTPLTAADQHALDALDASLALPELPDNLLPRAAALIPQLIALLRQTSLPVSGIAERVAKDAVLSAELMRLASSPYYRVQGEVTNLEQAITLVGLHGLETVIARVLLKPIYRAAPGPLSSQVGPRVWEHSEALARHAGILAEPAGQAVFDAYLAGLLHDTGWTVALCVLDRAGISITTPLSRDFAGQMADRAHRLFGLAAQRWEITPGFVALAQDARLHGAASGAHPLVPVLQQAEQRSMEELSPL